MRPGWRERVVLVTGSARGIGAAIAARFGEAGAQVVVSDVQADLLHASAALLRGRGVEVLDEVCDVSDPAACQALVDAAVARFGGLDVVVNNAGISIVSDFAECRPAAMRKLIEVNLLGAMYLTQAALPHLVARRGSVVFVSSVSGIRAIPQGAVYSASKAGLRSLAEALRLELAPAGVHVGVVSPGFTTSDGAKTVMNGDGTPRPIDRPPHDTPEGVARQVQRLVEGRERERVLTPLGKATAVLQRLSPSLVDRVLAGRRLRS
jgi:dehydrogenase/reductase SDR family protein 7B